jgi:hypothetical protein
MLFIATQSRTTLRHARFRSLTALVSASIVLTMLTIPQVVFADEPTPKGVDMEVDPDAPPPPPKELPPADPNGWGVGGKEEGEGKFAPQGKTGHLKDEEKDAEEAKKPEDYRPLPAHDVGLDMVFGFGSIRDVRSDTNRTQATVASIVPYFEWRTSERWSWGIRFPLSKGSIDGPSSNDDYKPFATGNFEAHLQAKFKLKRFMRLPVSFAIALPTGQGQMFPPADETGAKPQALLNHAAGASRGWEDQALFTPKRAGFVPAVGFTYDTRNLHFAARTKFELMVRTAGGLPATANDGTVHNPAMNWVTGVSFFYDFLDGKVSPGLRTWLAVSRLPESVRTSDYSGAQFVIEPEVHSTIPVGKDMAIRSGIGIILPVSGPIGGGNDSAIRGVSVNAGLGF